MIILFSFFGFLDSAYLTFEHYSGVIPPCSIVSGCERVLTSAYALIGSVPVSLIGVGYYLALLAVAIAYLETKKPLFLKIIFGLSVAGMIAYLWFVYLQVFVIQALCLYCLFSALMTLLVCITSYVQMVVLRTYHNQLS